MAIRDHMALYFFVEEDKEVSPRERDIQELMIEYM